MDLNNLSQPLREGIRIPTEDGRVKIVTPVFRISYPHLKEKYAGKEGKWKPVYQVTMIFNAKNPNIPAQVDLTKVMIPAIRDVLEISGGKFNKDDQNAYDSFNKIARMEIGGKQKDKDGNDIPGDEEGTRQIVCKNQEPIALYDSKRKPLDADWFKAGYYARGVLSLATYKEQGTGFIKVSYYMDEIQLLARGELLGGGSREYGDYMGSTDGETFDGAPPQDPAPLEDGGAPSDTDMWHAGSGGAPGDNGIPF